MTAAASCPRIDFFTHALPTGHRPRRTLTKKPSNILLLKVQRGTGIQLTMEVSIENDTKPTDEVNHEKPDLLIAKEETQQDSDLLRLPIWHADKNRDTLTAKQWTAYVQKAKELYNWTDEVTMKCVLNSLMGLALTLFYQLVRISRVAR